MLIERTPIPDLLVLTPRRFGDERGFFSESWNRRTLQEHHISLDFVQDNHSMSTAIGTLRGLHCQLTPSAQAKLVRCGRGRLLDVAVDIRRGSPAFGKWFGVELSFENAKQLLIPQGFLHGFVTREPNTEIIYKCSDYYDPATDRSVRYDDPEIGIDWGLAGIEPVVSEKDEAALQLKDLEHDFTYRETA
ncbi:MAG: dTDP-4-dehydrorhamnose 3,5-epimerase [Pseudomonadota bacterium]